ncbi:hypothetical protein ACQP2F_31745 [Actinoplanes sp. CA-030573]|uniref:hypothetical protein n=1 Tax=Actinoplanes sp. CA-030573 TaxID=3239898 RepID=UPI003D929A20
MTSANPRPGGWNRHPGVRAGSRPTAGERGCLITLTIGVLVAVAAVAAGHPGGSAWPAAALAAVAAVGVSVLLVTARRAERIARELALHHLDESRRSAAVAEDLRAEMRRLHDDVARLAAYADIAAYPARRR